MKAALIAVGAVVVIGAVVSASLLSGGRGTPAAQATPGSASTSSSSSSSPSPSPSPSSGVDPGASTGRTPGPLPEGTPTSGSEVPPPSGSAGHTLPPVTPAPALVSAPLPASGTKSGGLVAGFPTRIMGPAARTTVVSSSIATEGRIMQVALVGRSASSPADIRAHYALLWAALGLDPQQTTDGTTAFRGPYDSLTLSFVPSGTGTHYTVFGVFHTR
jgi:hypothetical protein